MREALRIPVKLLLALVTAEVVRLTLKLALGSSLIGIDVHSTDRIFGVHQLTPHVKGFLMPDALDRDQ
jgi:hypothetical protein